MSLLIDMAILKQELSRILGALELDLMASKLKGAFRQGCLEAKSVLKSDPHEVWIAELLEITVFEPCHILLSQLQPVEVTILQRIRTSLEFVQQWFVVKTEMDIKDLRLVLGKVITDSRHDLRSHRASNLILKLRYRALLVSEAVTVILQKLFVQTFGQSCLKCVAIDSNKS